MTTGSSSHAGNGSSGSRPVVLVTGAGSGIGAATASRFASEGWDVVLMGRRLSVLESTALEIRTRLSKSSAANAGHHIAIFQFDVAASDSKTIATNWLKENQTIADRVHAIVHNAGIVERTSTLASTDLSWHQTFETNVFGVIRLTQAAYPFLKKNRGVVLNVASTLGLRPILETAAYSASKAALINWSHGFAKEAGPDGVRVNCVCPGIVDTPIQDFHSASNKQDLLKAMASLQPLGRIGQPEEIAHMLWSLAAPGSEWTTGAVVNVDGGINL